MEMLRELAENYEQRIRLEDNMEMLTGICEDLAESAGASVVIIDGNGRVLAEVVRPDEKFVLRSDKPGEGRIIDSLLNDQLKNIVEIRENLDMSNFYIKNLSKTEQKKYVLTAIPIGAKGNRAGTALLYRCSGGFNKDELLLIQFSSLIISLIVNYTKDEIDTEASRRINIVKSAIGTLSYSELEAVLHIFQELGGSEGLLIASKIADRVGITRSVIVNALRKLESAGVIESRSLGMKGTYIKVLNDLLMSELKKLRN